ncbi:MAG: flavin oxidoreductase/NADH oxidase [Clostridia bacterium]|nr:flavin oxidoreductase/NADH oxidase [Clostridia bacterium]
MNTWKRPMRREDLPASLPFGENLEILKMPLALGKKTIPNRICYQPMEGCDGTATGAPDELTHRRYLRFAKGGAGLIWFEATAIVPEGRANPRQMYLSEETADVFAALVRDIKSVCLAENGYEPVVICQLTHSGRWSKPQGTPAPLIAYNKPIFEGDDPLPASCIVSDDYLDGLAKKYALSAKLAQRAGFDGVDIKACHGYLLSELLNAYTREGRYGGSYENRTRLFFSAVEAVKKACSPDFILASRFNAYDGYAYPYGMGDSGTPGVPDLTEAARIASDLAARGVTLLNVTMGCPYTNHEVNRPTSFAKEEAPYRSIERMLAGAEAVTKAAPGTQVVCSGLSFMGTLGANVAAGGIEEGKFSLAGFGRQTFSYPDLARDIVKGEGMKPGKLCLTCGKCTELMRAKQTPGCVIYDRELYTALYNEIHG